MVKCPYCGSENDMYGIYEENGFHECYECLMTFSFTTNIEITYRSNKADCLNGLAECDFYSPKMFPVTKRFLKCINCNREKYIEFED